MGPLWVRSSQFSEIVLKEVDMNKKGSVTRLRKSERLVSSQSRPQPDTGCAKSETKLSKDDFDDVRKKVWFSCKAISVEAEGSLGGLAIAWNPNRFQGFPL
ncbi:hypothetical protein KI387_041438, partial [Taxus chinensis]